ncbi:MAG: LamG domain-containing protein [bacterium]|nr:LamG domain-containing protein [bacterium]
MRLVSIFSLIALVILALATMGTADYDTSFAQTGGFSMRFMGYGNLDLGRVKIPIHPHRSIDVGGDPTRGDSGDFTIEFWMKADSVNNATPSCNEGTDTWINGNILIDRDLFGNVSYGDYGVSLCGNQIAFGVNNGTSGLTIVGGSTIANNTWRHIAVTRRRADGQMQIFVDGTLVRQANGPTGNISYDDNRNISNFCNPGGISPCNNEPFIVIGAEKHDYNPALYPPYNGFFDELRISDNVRYTANFLAPTAPFMPDINTMALYHFDEGANNIIYDSSGNNNTANRRFAGFTNGPNWSSDTPFGGTLATPTASTTPQGYRTITLPLNELLYHLKIQESNGLTYLIVASSQNMLTIYSSWNGIVAVTHITIVPQSYMVLFQTNMSTLIGGGALSSEHQDILRTHIVADLSNAFTSAMNTRYTNYNVQDIFVTAQQITIGVSIFP